MKLGGAITLLVVGLVLALRVIRFPYEIAQYVNFSALGWILVICGALGILLLLWGEYMASRRTITYQDQTRRDEERRWSRENRRNW